MSEREIPFVKMHGTANDFVIIDCRTVDYNSLNYEKIANRKTGIGCDQIIILRKSDVAACKMDIFNADGSRAEMCGNAARCVLHFIAKRDRETIAIELSHRVIYGQRIDEKIVKINMGRPLYDWNDIPVAKPVVDTSYLSINIEPYACRTGVATNIGNPHFTIFVDDDGDVDDEQFAKYAPLIENHRTFPNRVNVSLAKIINDNEIKVRVWERGVGFTDSCGSAACAAFVAAVRRGYTKSSQATIKLLGGDLLIEFDGENVHMTGEVTSVFRGTYYQ